MDITTTYKHIQHGYVRATREWNLLLCIPRWKRFDASFKQTLITKGKRLLARQQQHTILSRRTATHIRIRWVWVDLQTLPHDIDTYIRTICYEQASKRATQYSERLGYSYNQLRIKKVRSKRWSCSSKQNININLDLVHIEKKYLEYVVVHEVCHLQHKHHQKTFRDAVAALYPHYKEVRKELRKISFH